MNIISKKERAATIKVVKADGVQKLNGLIEVLKQKKADLMAQMRQNRSEITAQMKEIRAEKREFVKDCAQFVREGGQVPEIEFVASAIPQIEIVSEKAQTEFVARAIPQIEIVSEKTQTEFVAMAIPQIEIVLEKAPTKSFASTTTQTEIVPEKQIETAVQSIPETIHADLEQFVSSIMDQVQQTVQAAKDQIEGLEDEFDDVEKIDAACDPIDLEFVCGVYFDSRPAPCDTDTQTSLEVSCGVYVDAAPASGGISCDKNEEQKEGQDQNASVDEDDEDQISEEEKQKQIADLMAQTLARKAAAQLEVKKQEEEKVQAIGDDKDSSDKYAKMGIIKDGHDNGFETVGDQYRSVTVHVNSKNVEEGVTKNTFRFQVIKSECDFFDHRKKISSEELDEHINGNKGCGLHCKVFKKMKLKSEQIDLQAISSMRKQTLFKEICRVRAKQIEAKSHLTDHAQKIQDECQVIIEALVKRYNEILAGKKK